MKRVSAVVLAAGPSRRFAAAGGDLKQLLRFGGESLVRRTTRAALGSAASQVLVVVGCRADEVAAEVEDLAVELASNPGYEEGQSSSVRAGLGRVESAADGALFLPCDQPFLGAETIDALLGAYSASAAGIVVPTFAGARRAPVLFDRSLFDDLARITGDSGGRQLFSEHAERLLEVELADGLTLRDIDTPEDYESLAREL